MFDQDSFFSQSILQIHCFCFLAGVFMICWSISENGFEIGHDFVRDASVTRRGASVTHSVTIPACSVTHP